MLASLIRAVVCLGLLGACAKEVPPPLSAEQRARYTVTQVEATVTPDTEIWWGAGDAQVAQAAGIDTSEGLATSQYIDSPEGKAALGALLQARLAPTIETQLQGALGGTTPAQVSVVITVFRIPSSAQLLLIGGSSAIQAAVQVFDLETGAALLPKPEYVTVVLQKPGGIVGAIANAASSDEETTLATALGGLTRQWLQLTIPATLNGFVGADKAPPDIPPPGAKTTAGVPIG